MSKVIYGLAYQPSFIEELMNMKQKRFALKTSAVSMSSYDETVHIKALSFLKLILTRSDSEFRTFSLVTHWTSLLEMVGGESS